jgi:hypothetical protein
METVKNYLTLKSELKQLASELRNDKASIKQTQKECGSGAACDQQAAVVTKKRTCRHRHIAYSMMRGRTYEQIEAKCREGNSPDQNLIQEIIRAYGTQDVCAGAA